MIINEYFLLPPNWASPVVYKRRWMTAILSALDNTEQRSMHHTWPRRGLSFSILTKDYIESSYLKSRLHKNIHGVYGVPFWEDMSLLNSMAASGQKNLSLDTRWRNFDVGGKCVVIESLSSYEVGTISVLADGQITLADNLVSTWDKGSEVYPILAGRIESGSSYNLVTSAMSEINIEVSEEFDEDVVRFIGDASGYPFYRGYPLFDKRPNWHGRIEYQLDHPYSFLSFLGKSVSFTHRDETEFMIKTEHLVKTKEEAWELVNFFDHCVGRWNGFWVPSYQQDIKIQSPFGSGDTQLIIGDVDFSAYWLDQAAGSNLMVEWPNGDYVCVGITNFTPPDTLSLDVPIGKAGNLWQLPYITASFLYFGRLNQDELEIEYITSQYGKIKQSMRTCFKETPES